MWYERSPQSFAGRRGVRRVASRAFKIAILVGILMAWTDSARPAYGQGVGGQTANTPPKPDGYILPAANRPPDANDRMLMDEQRARKANFDKVNTERIRLIEDETAKLLILTRDLKAKMDRIGQGPYPSEIAREMEVIEILAHDVKAKMKLTIGGG